MSEIDQQEFIENLMLEFREIVLGIQEEQRDLKEKLQDFPLIPPSASTIDSQYSLSSSSSTRPPSYKTVLKLEPLPPIRTKRKSNRMPTMAPNSPSITRGILIVLEGLDRVGKSTLAKRLVEHLERSQKPVTYMRFPERTTTVGKVINEFLTNKTKPIDNHALHLLFSANRWELQKEIRDYINKGTTVVVDRYSYSGIAYSSADKNIPFDWCCQTELGLPKPDLVIYLELSSQKQQKRTGFGDERFEYKDLQESIRANYLKLMNSEVWHKVDVDDKSPDEILGEVILPVRKCFEKTVNKDLESLKTIP